MLHYPVMVYVTLSRKRKSIPVPHIWKPPLFQDKNTRLSFNVEAIIKYWVNHLLLLLLINFVLFFSISSLQSDLNFFPSDLQHACYCESSVCHNIKCKHVSFTFVWLFLCQSNRPIFNHCKKILEFSREWITSWWLLYWSVLKSLKIDCLCMK